MPLAIDSRARRSIHPVLPPTPGTVKRTPQGRPYVPERALAGWAEPYTVRRGDTLGVIADRLGLTVELLVNVNPAVNHPDRITAGMKLNVPRLAGSTYIVKRGDSLSSIADHIKGRFGLATPLNGVLSVVHRVNDLPPGRDPTLYAGEVLIIPSRASIIALAGP